MDQDDPEGRIAEPVHQLAESHAAGDPGAAQGYSRSAATTGRRLTPEQVQKLAFSKPRFGKRGYEETEVDAFVDLVEAKLRDPKGHTLTPEAVHNLAFSKPPFGKRGYNEDEVDAFLNLVEQQLSSQ
jgi:DivIVA domain-containing protein